MKTKSPTSPRINPSDPEILSKLLGKRVPLQHALTQDRRIQVTLDADTFIKLWIKESSDALTIKHAVLQKLSIDADPSYFYFYHENGVQSSNVTCISFLSLLHFTKLSFSYSSDR